MIVGLTGRKGHGKDTAAAELVWRNGWTRLAFADALKESAAALFDVPVETWDVLKNNPHALVSLTAPAYGSSMTVREFLQRYGTEAHREVFGDSFWLDVIEKQLAASRSSRLHSAGWPNIVVTDVRFDNEAALIRKYGGIVVEVYRPQVVDAGDTHASEQIPRADATVWNDDTRAVLHSRLRSIIASRLS
jgi:Deoxynucleotide monophosphate kinase